MSRSLLLAGAVFVALSSTAVPAQTRVELIEVGTAPHQPLRYSFQQGRSERAVLDTNMRLALSFGGQMIPMGDLPPIRMTLQMQTAEVAADGSARIGFELLSAEAEAGHPQTAQINQALANTKGLSGSYRVDPRGQVSDSQVDAPAEGTAPQGGAAVFDDLERSMQQLAAPFPEQPVGPGARWRVSQNVENADMRMSQTAEYTLRSRQGNRIELDVKMTDASLEALGGLPPGAKVDAVKIEGGGSSAIALDGLVPTARVDATFDMSLSMQAEGQTQNLGMNMQMRQAIAPAN